MMAENVVNSKKMRRAIIGSMRRCATDEKRIEASASDMMCEISDGDTSCAEMLMLVMAVVAV